MLSALRERSSGIVVKILLVLLILSFAAWGISDVFSPSGPKETVATVGEVEISAQAAADEIQREMRRLAPLFGGNISREQARAIGVPDMALRRMVERSLLDAGARDLGLTVSDAAIRRNIEGNEAFFNQIGHFDRYVFSQVLQQNNLSEDSYVATLRRDLPREHLIGIAKGVHVPDTLVRALYKVRFERRVAETVTLKTADINDIAKPGEDDLKAFHKDNAGRFTAPEYRKLTAVTLNTSELAPSIAVSEEDLKAAFAERESEFFKSETRELEQILVKTEAEAKKAAAALKAGGDFMAVAKDAGMDVKAVPLGSRTKSDLSDELADPAFALAEGTTSAPIKSAFGWHIIRAAKVMPEHKQTLVEVSDILKKDIQSDRAVDALYDLSNRLEDTLGGGATLEEAAKAMNLNLLAIAAVDGQGRDPANTLVRDAADRTFLQAAFALPEGEVSALTETGTDGYFIVRVDAITPPTLRPLETVRKDVEAAFLADARKNKAETAAKAIVDALKGGADFAALAARDHGSTVITTPPITRTGEGLKGIDLPSGVIAQLFEAKTGDSFFGKTRDGVVVARLTRVDAAKTDTAQMAKLKDELTGMMESDLLAGMVSGFGVKHPVDVNRRALDQLF